MTRIILLVRTGVLSAVIVGLVSGCSGYRPDPPDEPTPIFFVSGLRNLQRPGDVVQLSAIDIFRKPIDASQVSWSVADQRVATARPDGLLTAVGYGRTVLYATYLGSTNKDKFDVMPAGMFLITGKVTYEGIAAVPEANVSVLQQDGSETATTTDQSGWFRLPGLGNVVIRAHKDGYSTGERSITVARDMKQDVSLTRLGMFGSIAGPWALTFTASAGCTALPPEAMRRQLSAKFVEPEGDNTLFVHLVGPTVDFGFWGAGFVGTRTGNTVHFTMFDTLGGDREEAFVEQLDAHRTLGVSGTATGTLDGETIVAQLDGHVRVRGGTPEAILAECAATDHKLEFTRAAGPMR